MEGKKKVTIYTDWNESIKNLNNSDAGKLFKHLLSYVNDENPPELNGTLKFVWIPIKQTLKRDLAKWLETCEKNSQNASEGWRKRKAKQSERMPPHAKNADKDSDIDIDRDIDRDSLISDALQDNSERFIHALRYIGTDKVKGKYLLKDLFKERAKQYSTNEEFWKHFESWGKKFEMTDFHKSEAKKLYGQPQRYLTYEELEDQDN